MLFGLPPTLLAVLLAGLVDPHCGGAVEAAVIRGVAPADRAKYGGGTFRCLDGSGSPLPAEAVNDDFCDCADGSDEPGTGACAGHAGTLFFCPNEGSTARKLYASRIGDGICDCCDGSDEAALAARFPTAGCKNVCAQQGRREQEETARRLRDLKEALAKQEQNRRAAIVDRERWRSDIMQLQQALPPLEAAFEAAKVAADAERQVEEALKANATGDNSSCMWRQTGGCSPSGAREPSSDKPCSLRIERGNSGFCDCDGDGQKGATEHGYNCQETPGLCLKVCSADAADNAAQEASRPEQEAEGAEEKPQVSEYARWMDGAASTLSDSGGSEQEAGKAGDQNEGGEKQQVSEYAKWMEGAESSGPSESATPPSKEESGAHSDASATAASEASEAAAPSAIDSEREAQKLVDENKAKTKELLDKLDALPEAYLGYSSLAGMKLSKRISDFDYKVEFFGSATQDYTSLGRWTRWTGRRSGVFENGQSCWEGPQRKLNVVFECGTDAALVDVQEPSRCVYEATVTHPGACDPAELEALSSGTRVLGPREEL